MPRKSRLSSKAYLLRSGLSLSKSARRSGKKSTRRSGKKSARRSGKKSARRSGKKSGNATRYHGLFDLVPEWLGGKHEDTNWENLLRVDIYNNIRKIWRETSDNTTRVIELVKLMYYYDFNPSLEVYFPDASGKCKADSFESKPAPYYILKDLAKELYAADFVNAVNTIAEQVQKFAQFDKEAAEMRITLGIPTPLPHPYKIGFEMDQNRLWTEYSGEQLKYDSFVEKNARSIPKELRGYISNPTYRDTSEYRKLDENSKKIVESFTWANEYQTDSYTDVLSRNSARRTENKLKEMREELESRRKKYEDAEKSVLDMKEKLKTIKSDVEIKLGMPNYSSLRVFVQRTDTKTNEVFLTNLGTVGYHWHKAISDLKGAQPLAAEGLLSRSANEIPEIPLNSYWLESSNRGSKDYMIQKWHKDRESRKESVMFWENASDYLVKPL